MDGKKFLVAVLVVMVIACICLALTSCGSDPITSQMRTTSPLTHNDPAVGTHKVLWLLAKDQGQSTPSVAAVRGMADDIEAYIALNSLGQFAWDIDVYGWYTTSCNVAFALNEYGKLPDEALWTIHTQDLIDAADPDVDFSVEYDAIVQIRVNCGGGSTGGNGDYTPYVTDEGPFDVHRRATVRALNHLDKEVLAHEMLHGYYRSESVLFTCAPPFPLDHNDCPRSSYRDIYTIMSAPQFGGNPLGDAYLCARDREELDWVVVPEVGDGVYTLSDHTTGDAIKVRRSFDRYWYLELRDGKVQARLNRWLWTDDLTTFTDPAGPVIVASGPVVTVTAGAPDTTLPTGSITNPNEAATVSGDVLVSFTGSNDIVEIYLRNGANTWNHTFTSKPYRYTLDTTVFWDGMFILKAWAYDAVGNQLFDEVRFTIDNANPDPGGGNGGGPKDDIQGRARKK